MSVTSAMFTGVSGLLANAEGINVIGNNLANVNTVGFKSGRMLFSDVLSANIGNNSQIGRGTQIQTVDNIFGQGTFETTESVTDLALQGNSFFAVMDPNATAPVNQNSALLTRAGAFRLDSNYTLVNPDGYQVLDTQGNPVKFSDNAAAIAAANTAITAATAAASTAIDAVANVTEPFYITAATAISTEATAQATAAAAFDTAINALAAPATPATVAETTASGLIKTAADAAKTAADTAVTTPNATNIAAAQAAFNALNTLTNSSSFADDALALYTPFRAALNTSNTTVDAAMTMAAAAKEAAILIDPVVVAAKADLATATGLAFSKITKIDASGLITYLGKDGITSNYYNTSGQVGLAANAVNAATVQRLAVVAVANSGGLEKVGGTLFRPTTSSGISSAAFSLADNSANGSSEKIYTNSLEQSNVDMAAQFVKMILTQRAYSANSKTITTADEMTQEVLQLKR
ncbi:MAG: flagellar hook-basal body complex protein [Desulfuromonadaceae bacterium]|nr:flagellar hook-basal body complex protein [Desulfuromonadaceae bacterium]